MGKRGCMVTVSLHFAKVLISEAVGFLGYDLRPSTTLIQGNLSLINISEGFFLQALYVRILKATSMQVSTVIKSIKANLPHPPTEVASSALMERCDCHLVDGHSHNDCCAFTRKILFVRTSQAIYYFYQIPKSII